MQRMMQPDLLFEEQSLNQSSFRGGQSPQALAVLIDDFLDRAYARLRDDRFIRTLHLLISEGPRANDLLEAWRRRHLELLQQQQGALHLAVDQGKLRDSALTDMVQLIHAPILLGAVLVMLQDEKHANDVLPRLRSAHRRLLLEMLPRETDSA
ncbi:hypothetical protein [Paracandidimonas lactea]|uniref:hypothetical protein n=1 Tax=Paracandidimonas lactea TaxID=2895524 RepID=UPI001F2518B9|nr:hypothetical protein [Paracandidimonas lactea]